MMRDLNMEGGPKMLRKIFSSKENKEFKIAGFKTGADWHTRSEEQRVELVALRDGIRSLTGGEFTREIVDQLCLFNKFVEVYGILRPNGELLRNKNTHIRLMKVLARKEGTKLPEEKDPLYDLIFLTHWYRHEVIDNTFYPDFGILSTLKCPISDYQLKIMNAIVKMEDTGIEVGDITMIAESDKVLTNKRGLKFLLSLL